MTATFALSFAAAAALAALFVFGSAWKVVRGRDLHGARTDMAWSVIPLGFLLWLGAFLLSHG